MSLQPWMVPAHLAPGDGKCLIGDWGGFDLHRVNSTNDPLFSMAYGSLWSEFGAAGEMEGEDILAARMERPAGLFIDGVSLNYTLQLVTREGAFVGVRDHTVILLENEPGAVVHLSHNLVHPHWRRSGIAGWLRALPITTAEESLSMVGRSKDAPITLVGEMEPLNASKEDSWVRLAAYQKAGFKMVDPTHVDYLQPDFRPPSVIDASGGAQPIPLRLMLRKYGHENEVSIMGCEVRRCVRFLYKMYAAGFRASDMLAVESSLENYPADDEVVALVPPTGSA